MVQKVLLVGPLPPKYGGTTISFQLFRDFLLANKARNQVVRVLNSNTGDKSSISLLSPGTSVDLIILAIRIVVRSIASDKIVIFGSQRFITLIGSLVLALFAPFGKPIYLRVFGGGYDEYYRDATPLMQAFIRRILPRAKRIVVQTEFVRSRMLGVLGSVVCAVPNCRWPVSIPVSPSVASSQKVSFIYSGLVRQLKGCKELLDAFVDLIQRMEDSCLGIELRLDVYGDVVRSDREPLDLTPYAHCPQIKVHGFVDDTVLQQKYSAADVFVFPSYWPTEGHSGSVIEAMMHGLPVVATEWRAMRELVTPGVNGLLCRPGDSGDLADKLFLISTDATLRQKLSKGALCEGKKFDANRILPSLCNVFDLPLGDKPTENSAMSNAYT